MKKTKIKIFITIIVILILGIILTVASKSNSATTPGEYDAFATCLKDKGVVFYGAFWCPHCKAQKALFGSSEKYLPYVECSTPDALKQTQVCIDKKIMGYPTWEFPDGTTIAGEASLQTLSQKTSCLLPQ
jgi:hypothetical protein